MMEVNQPGKLFIGGLSREANEKTLKAVFGKHGPLSEAEVFVERVTLATSRRKTSKSKLICALAREQKKLKGDYTFLYGKAIKVEQANKPSFQSGGTRRISPPSRHRSPLGSLKSIRNSSGGTRGRHHSRGRHLGDGGYTLDLHMSSSRGTFGVKRGPSSRIGSPPPKKSAPSTVARSNGGMGGQGRMSRGRESYAGPLRREPFSWRNDSTSPRDDAYATKDRNHPSFRDTRCYSPPRKDYAWCDYGRSRRDEHSSRGYGEHDGRDRDDSGHPSRCSYRDAYQSYYKSPGTSRGAAPAPAPRMTFGGSSRHDYNNTRDRYDRSRESYSRSRGDFYSSGREHSGRKERTYPPSVDRVRRDPHEECGSSSYRASRKGVGEDDLKRRLKQIFKIIVLAYQTFLGYRKLKCCFCVIT
ncbi:PREDICTED: RNA-binding motif protein, X chromosome-like [Rhinopithecus bieti]|uniref:RNA-binding motif protein, X chromosome-like n=1 Tax=Rhinopithecus bieti TaxID=61621 RepID=UPI00083C3FDC|nr:PREDICTED: RNA-binding motif protein, X chromosome-like [Rhinopithecus bieti]